MGKSTKAPRLREEMSAAVKQYRQTTLDCQPEVAEKESAKAVESGQRKRIVITGIETVPREDELALKVGFRLVPSKTAFSKITTDLYFDGQKLSSVRISIPQGPLGKDDFELTPLLDMRGISAGSHSVKVEMCELWFGEKLNCASKEVAVEYVPKGREDRLIEIPIVKSVAGTDLAVVSDSEKGVYREIEESVKKELISERDQW